MALYQLVSSPIDIGAKSGKLNSPDDYTRKMLAWRESAKDEALSTLRMHPEYGETQSYIDWLEGRQWAQNRPRYRSHFYDNRVAEARQELISLLTDIRPTIEVTCDIRAYQPQADIAKHVLLYEWQRNSFDLELMSLIDHALLGTAYWKIGAELPGRLRIAACGMDTVLPIQPGRTIQDATAVLYRTYKPVQYFKNKWGSKADGIEKEQVSTGIGGNVDGKYARPGHIAEYSWNSLSPAMRYHLGVKSQRQMPKQHSSFPVVELEEYYVDDPSVNEGGGRVLVKDPNLPIEAHNYWYYVEPGERLFPRKRLIVFGGNRVMYDGPSMFWSGLYPFAELNLIPIVWGPGGMSHYRNLLPLNKAINEVGAGTYDVVKRALVPQIITRDKAVNDQTWQQFSPDRPGGRLKVNSMVDPSQAVRYIDPPTLPQYIFSFLGDYLLPTFDRRSGRVDITGLGRKNQVPGGETIEQMRDSLQTPFRLYARLIENFLQQAGVQAISNIFQFFTMERRMQIMGADGITAEDFDFDPKNLFPANSLPREDFWRMFSLHIAPGSLHSGSKDREKQVAISLFRLNAISRRQLLRTLGINNIDAIENEIREEREQMMTPNATGKGEVPRLTRSSRTGNPF